MSKLYWIKISDRLLECIYKINQLDDEKYSQIVEVVYKKKVESNTDGVIPSIEDLQNSTGLSEQELVVAVKTLSHIYKRATLFILKPTKLQADLKNVLKLNESKADIFIQYWVKITKPILDNLETNSGKSNELQNVTWKLQTQLSSEAQQKEKTGITVLQLQTSDERTINLETNHTELLGIYNQLEEILLELDSLKKI